MSAQQELELHNARLEIAHYSRVSAGLQMRAEMAEARCRDLEAALTETKLQRDSWKRIAESGLGITAETFDEQQSGPTDVEPSIKMKNEMREILGHEPLADQPIPDNTWLCVCGYVVKKRYICLCGGRENNSEASRFEAKIDVKHD